KPLIFASAPIVDLRHVLYIVIGVDRCRSDAEVLSKRIFGFELLEGRRVRTAAFSAANVALALELLFSFLADIASGREPEQMLGIDLGAMVFPGTVIFAGGRPGSEAKNGNH